VEICPSPTQTLTLVQKHWLQMDLEKMHFHKTIKGYITHIIPPKEFSKIETSIEFNAIDVNATVVGVASTGHLYLYAQTNPDVPPENVLEGYRIGARENDTLKVVISVWRNSMLSIVLEL
jgi:hypothetical protein